VVCFAIDWPHQIVPGTQGLLSSKSKPTAGFNTNKTFTFPTSALALKSPQSGFHQIRRAKSYTWASQQPQKTESLQTNCNQRTHGGNRHSHSRLPARSRRKEPQPKLSDVVVQRARQPIALFTKTCGGINAAAT